jgi:ribulose-phosphate 3-epimerase
MEKVRYLHKKYPLLDIQVDGGIGAGNAEKVSSDGANWLVAGSALFCAEDRS